MYHQFSSIALIAATFATPSPAQIRPNSSYSGASTRPAAPAVQVLVSNPFPATPTDSTASVIVGTAMRDRLAKNLGGGYTIISRLQMNQSLSNSGFSADAMLNWLNTTQLAKALGARVIVYSALSKGADGNYNTRVRMVGISEAAGITIPVAQTPGEALPAYGARIADALVPVSKVYADARNCGSLGAAAKPKAAEAANKALKGVPGYGLAEYCLYSLEADSTGAEAITHLRAAVANDPLALGAWNRLAVVYQLKSDTTNAVQTYQRMLQEDPGNSSLLEDAFKLFRQYNRIDAAKQVAQNGIRLDSLNPDWHNLYANVCIQTAEYRCALEQTTQAFMLDSIRADTAFYQKAIFVAKSANDTAQYLGWARRAAQRYPEQVDILTEVGRAYLQAGQSDSAVAAMQRLIKVDPTKTSELLLVVQPLVDQGKLVEAAQFAGNIKQFGSQDDKNNFAGILINKVQPLASDTLRQADAVKISQAVLDVGSDNAQVIFYANYFLGAAAIGQLNGIAKALNTPQKSCELAKQGVALIDLATPALTAASTPYPGAQAGSTDGIVNYAKGVVAQIPGQRTAFAAQVTALCK